MQSSLTDSRENILLLSPEPPGHFSGGGISIYRCLAELVKRYNVYLLCLPDEMQQGLPHVALPDGVTYYRVFRRDRSSKAANYLASVIERKPYRTIKNRSRDLARELRSLLRQHHFSACLIEFSYMAEYQSECSMPKILNMHNVESAIFDDEYIKHEPMAKQLLRKWERSRILKWEIEMVRQFDVITFITADDLRQMALLTDGKFVGKMAVLNRGVDRHAEGHRTVLAGHGMLFVGSMSYEPNIDAVCYFSERIFPLIKRAIPDASFTIVGRHPPARVFNLTREPGITVTGFVDDVTVYYNQATVVVIPMRAGGGVKMKLLEAIGYGVPVVATTKGAMGVDLRDGEDILIADDPVVFAEHCIDLLTHSERCTQIGERARERAAMLYPWERTGKALADIIEQAKTRNKTQSHPEIPQHQSASERTDYRDGQKNSN